MKSYLEWYLGIPASKTGQGTEWSWLHEKPWPSGMPQWSVLLVAVLAVGFVVSGYRRQLRGKSWLWPLLLSGLRLAAIGVVLLVLTQLKLAVDRTGLPFLAVLVDDSASMSLEDRYADADQKKAAQEYQKTAERNGSSRLALTKSLLTRNDGDFLKRLQATHQVRVYRFSDSAVPIGGLELAGGQPLSDLLTSISALRPDGADTRPAEAIRKVLSDFRGTLPTAIVVITDGVATTGEADKLTVGAGLAAAKAVPLYPVAVGTEDSVFDLNLYDVQVEEVAFVDDPLKLTGKLKSFGFKGKPVTVTLREKDERTPLATQQVTAPENGQTLPLEITWTPTKPGEYQLVLEVSPQPTEVDKTNNSELRQVSVREGRVKVLLIDSIPRWEYRDLKFMLEREKTIELHTVLQDADLEYADQDLVAQPLRGRFPVSREQLNDYDVILFGDVDPRLLSQNSLDNIREFVRESGGGLLLISGPQHMPQDYRGTALETLLPIEFDGLQVPSSDVPILDAFQSVLTVEGQKSTPIFRFDENDLDSLIVWKRLPGMHWFVEAPQLKPGATVLVEHPTKRSGTRGLPIIAMQRFGAGKILWHATDETWQWRRRVGDLYYGRYWVQAIRFLSRSRLLGQSKQAELRSDRSVYQRDDTINLRVRFFNEAEAPTTNDGVQVNVERRNGTTQLVTLQRVPQSPHVFEGQVQRPLDGTYHAWVAKPDFAQTPPSTDFRVESPDREFKVRGTNHPDIQSAAKISHGRAYNLATVEKLPDDIPVGQPIPLRSEEPIVIWNRWEVLAIFASLLTTEWLLRKRLRLR